jgi:hypothetical protein
MEVWNKIKRAFIGVTTTLSVELADQYRARRLG